LGQLLSLRASLLDTHCTFAGKAATSVHRGVAASVPSIFRTCWSEFVPISSRFGQDLRLLARYSIGQRSPEGCLATLSLRQSRQRPGNATCNQRHTGEAVMTQFVLGSV